MIQKELQRLNNDPNFIPLYHTAIDAFKRSGVLDVLRLLGQPFLVFDGKDQSALAAQAARSVGWNAAINTLLEMEAIIDAAIQPTTTPKFKYGGLKAAEKRGDISKEESYAIEHGLTPPEPGFKRKPAPAPTGEGNTDR